MNTPESAARELLAVKDQLAKLDKEYKDRKKPLQEKAELIERWFKIRAEKEGVEGWKTSSGTIFFSTLERISVADFQQTISFIKEHDAYELLTNAVSKKAVLDWKKEHGELPPGLNYSAQRTVNFRKPRAKAD